MITPEFENLVRRTVAADTAERDTMLARRMVASRNSLASKGMLGSGNAAIQHTDTFRSEIRVRVEAVRLAIHRALQAYPAQRGAREDLGRLAKELSSDLIDRSWTGVLETARPDLASMQGVIGHMVDEMNEAKAAALEWLAVEIDHLCLPSSSTGSSSNQTFNFNAPVGAVLTGPHSSANVQMSTESLSQLVKALDALHASVTASLELPAELKVAVIETIDDARKEAGRTEPNRVKLTGLLNGVGTAVQALADVRDAYERVKIWAVTIGLFLVPPAF